VSRPALCVGVCLVALASSGGATAQRSVNVERFEPALDRFGFLGIQGTASPAHKRWNVGLWTHYAKSPLTVRLLSGEPTVIKHRLTANLQFQMGLFGRWAIAVDAPFVLYQEGDASRLMDGGHSLRGGAVGDPRIVNRVRVLGKPTKPNQERPDGPGIAVLFAVPVPIGHESRFAGEGQFTFDLQTLADFHVLGAGGGIMIGWRYRGDERVIGARELGQELLYGLGLKVPIPVATNLFGMLELRGSTSFRGRDTNTLEGELGVRYLVDGFALTAAVGTGIVRGLGAPNLRAVVGFSWSPQSKDFDGDGIPDGQDECPRLPEDLDGFQDEDGCTDPDNDNDFIPDADDRCPNEEAIEGRDLDEDGCTDPE
jgi:OmpA-OmpF porin, OOP family